MKKFTLNKKWLGLWSILALFPAALTAQERCGHDDVMRELYEKHPEFIQEQRELLEQNKQFIKDMQGETRSVYIIPVVFHILHEYGVENISDEQIFGQMEQLNRDFRHLNADSTDIVPAFKHIAGDSKIEFRLATKDFAGNCTNGIDRIYTHEHRAADDYSKLNPWPRNRYLNVWVTSQISKPGVAGYAYKPIGADSPGMYLIDGIILKHDYVGITGTGAYGRGRTLSHEVGHYLGLSHPWGPTNDPGVGCGDDEVEDTPKTKGFTSCTLNNAVHCTIHNNKMFSTFEKVTTSSGTTDSTGTGEDPGLTTPGFKAVGVSANSTVNGSFAFSGWGTGAADGETLYSEMTGSLDPNKYYEITVEPVLGYEMELTGISFYFARNETGVRTYAVRSSVDNFATNLAGTAAPFVPPSSNMSVETGNVFFIKKDTTSLGNSTNISLTGAAYTKRAQPITFRFYGWNAEMANGTFRLDSVRINGKHGKIENIQNIMEYAFCSKMFTKQQGYYMQGTLNNSIANRNNLWTTENHKLTGIDAVGPVVCAPLADFSSSTKYVCPDAEVTFNSSVGRAVATGYSWTFQDGTPSEATTSSAKVKFTGTGWKKVTLTVSNATGSDTKTVDDYIFVSPPFAYTDAPFTETFEGETAQWWLADNPSQDQKFELVSWGNAANKAFGLKNVVSNPLPGYYERLGGRRDAIISPSFNMLFAKGAKLTFKYSCATRAIGSNEITEKLVVYYSIDCGETWLERKSLTGVALANAGQHGNSFVPSSESHWKTESLVIPVAATANGNIRFKFEYTSSDKSNNIYLDDINVSMDNVGVDENGLELIGLNVFPNPGKNGQALNIEYTSNGNAKITVADVLGKVVYAVNDQKGAGEHSMVINMGQLDMGPGVYFVNVSDGSNIRTKKVIIY